MTTISGTRPATIPRSRGSRPCWLRSRIGTTWWRRTHLVAVPTFAFALVHGVFAGTDSREPWMFWTYVATGLLVLFLVVVRGLTAGFLTHHHGADFASKSIT